MYRSGGMVPRGKASQVALGRGGNWTAGEEKGGASFWETSRGCDRLPRAPVPCLARADRKVVEAGVAYWLLPPGKTGIKSGEYSRCNVGGDA